MLDAFAAVVLAGGRAARLGGVDKASIEIDGRTLLTWALDAVVDAAEVVVVGEQVPTGRPVTFVREDPPYGGPAAGLCAGLDLLLRPPALVAVLAVDMPRVTSSTVRRLRQAVTDDVDGAVLVGPDGRRQAALVLRGPALGAAVPSQEERHGLSLRRLLMPLPIAEVPALGEEHRDVDSWADLRDLRDLRG